MSESPGQSLVFDPSAVTLTAVPWQAWRPASRSTAGSFVGEGLDG